MPSLKEKWLLFVWQFQLISCEQKRLPYTFSKEKDSEVHPGNENNLKGMNFSNNTELRTEIYLSCRRYHQTNSIDKVYKHVRDKFEKYSTEVNFKEYTLNWKC